MTVAKIYAPTRTVGNGATSQFTADFQVGDTSEMIVSLVDTGDTTNQVTQVEDVDYSVTINTSTENATITFLLVDPPSTKDVILERLVAETQATKIPNVATIREVVLEGGYDKAIRLIQQLSEKIGRQSVLSVLDFTNSPTFNFDLPTPVSNAVLTYNSTALGFDTTVLTSASGFAYPATSGIMIATGAQTAISRVLSGSGGIIITNKDGVAGNPKIDGADITSQIKVDFAGNTGSTGASLLGIFDTAGKTSATTQEALNVELLANTIRTATGSFTANGANDRTITTSIPVGATILEVSVSQLAVNVTDYWHVGDSANHEQRGSSGNTRYVNGTTRFTLSGVDFKSGSLGANQGTGAVGWTIKYKL